MQLNKNIKIFINYFLGPLLFVWLSYAIYRQVMRQPRLEESWWQIKAAFHSAKIFYLVAAVLLIPVNWGLEALKWQLSLRGVHRVSLMQAFKAVLSGVSFSVTMPNRVGEYLGRMMYLPEGSRLKTISVTLAGSLAQLLVTLVAGTLAAVIMKATLLAHFTDMRFAGQFIEYALILSVFLLVLLYFNVRGGVRLFRRWLRTERYLYLVEALQHFDRAMLLRLLLLSFLRYLVFLFQYILILYLFDVNVGMVQITLVMALVFLVMAIVPSIALVEVWLRGETMIMLMGLYSANTLGIGFASVTVWFLNLVVPAILGSLLIFNIRVFRRRQ